MAHADDTSMADEAEVARLSDEYEAALVRNDIEAMNAVFLATSDVLRFGTGDMQQGFDEVVAWRATATPVNPQRRIVQRMIRALAPGVVAVDLVFRDGESPAVGRQSQTWVRRPEGWRIVRAHVSVITAPPPALQPPA
jgi:ketosteroid isomerase-like protein